MTPEQFAKWEPAREAHHQQTIARDKQRDVAQDRKSTNTPSAAQP